MPKGDKGHDHPNLLRFIQHIFLSLIHVLALHITVLSSLSSECHAPSKHVSASLRETTDRHCCRDSETQLSQTPKRVVTPPASRHTMKNSPGPPSPPCLSNSCLLVASGGYFICCSTVFDSVAVGLLEQLAGQRALPHALLWGPTLPESVGHRQSRLRHVFEMKMDGNCDFTVISLWSPRNSQQLFSETDQLDQFPENTAEPLQARLNIALTVASVRKVTSNTAAHCR